MARIETTIDSWPGVGTAVNQNCPHCGYIHSRVCPRISGIEYHQNGTIKRITYFKDLDAADHIPENG